MDRRYVDWGSGGWWCCHAGDKVLGGNLFLGGGKFGSDDPDDKSVANCFVRDDVVHDVYTVSRGGKKKEDEHGPVYDHVDQSGLVADDPLVKFSSAPNPSETIRFSSPSRWDMIW